MDEIEQLRRRCRELEAEKQRAIAEKQLAIEDKAKAERRAEQLQQKLEAKELELAELIRRVFGRKSERFIDDTKQLALDFGDDEQIADAIEGVRQAELEQELVVAEHRRQKRRRGREKLPEHLPRTVVVIDLPEEDKAGLKCIGEDVTETLEFSPPKLSVRETRYPKYVDPRDEDRSVVQAKRQPGLVEGNRYDTSVAAQVVTAKYGYHLPVYRQEDLFAGSGWNPSRSSNSR